LAACCAWSVGLKFIVLFTELIICEQTYHSRIKFNAMMSTERIVGRQSKHPFAKFVATPGKGKTRSSSQEAPQEARGIDAAASSSASQGALACCTVCLCSGCFAAPEALGLPAADADPEATARALKLFDLTGKYGPCTGLQRLERQAILCLAGQKLCKCAQGCAAISLSVACLGTINIPLRACTRMLTACMPAGGSAPRSWA
jgi:hypothetical protein